MQLFWSLVSLAVLLLSLIVYRSVSKGLPFNGPYYEEEEEETSRTSYSLSGSGSGSGDLEEPGKHDKKQVLVFIFVVLGFVVVVAIAGSIFVGVCWRRCREMCGRIAAQQNEDLVQPGN